ncbi:MAG: PD40 domain-containing protein [Nitrospirae bacterium]|nr:PD40 domain-containing protein [Nitrospirota bacterium]
MNTVSLFLGVVGLFLATGAIYFDGWWHITIGRDTFWIPPHTVLYTAIGLTTLGFLLRAWPQWKAGRPWDVPLKTWGGGVFLIFLSAPFDELWHRIFGRESIESLLIIWSPPHVVAISSAVAVGIGLLMALIRDGAPRGWFVALTLFTFAAVGGFLNILVIPFNPIDHGIGGPVGAFLFYLVFVSWRLAAVVLLDRPVLTYLGAMQWFFSSILFLPHVIEAVLEPIDILLFMLTGIAAAAVGDAAFVGLRAIRGRVSYPVVGSAYMAVAGAALYPLFNHFFHLHYRALDLALIAAMLMAAGYASGFVSPRIAGWLSPGAPDADRRIRVSTEMAPVHVAMGMLLAAFILIFVTLSNPEIMETRGPRLIGTEEPVARIPDSLALEKIRPRWTYVPPVSTSVDGRRIAYKVKHGDKFLIVVDGIPGREYDWIIDPPKFSRDGTRYMYPAWRGKKQRHVMVINGVESEEFDHLGLSFYFTDDGRPAYVGVREIESPYPPPAAADGKVPEFERETEGITMNERVYRYGDTGGHYSTWVARPGRRLILIRDEIPSPEYDEIGWIDFSPDGRRLAYSARIGDTWKVIADGVEHGDYELALPFGGVEHPAFFSPDGRRLAYAAKHGGKWHAVIDGAEGPAFDFVDAFGGRFSPDSRRTVYKAERSGKQFIVADGVEQASAYDRIGTTEFTPDGSTLAYLASRGNERLLVIDGVERPRPQGGWDWGLYFGFSPDGRRVAYVAPEQPKWKVFVDGLEPRAYHRILEPLFSPDGRHVAYAAALGTRWRVVVDGSEGKVYDAIAGLKFESSDRLSYIAVEGRSIVRVVHPLHESNAE